MRNPFLDGIVYLIANGASHTQTSHQRCRDLGRLGLRRRQEYCIISGQSRAVRHDENVLELMNIVVMVYSKKIFFLSASSSSP